MANRGRFLPTKSAILRAAPKDVLRNEFAIALRGATDYELSCIELFMEALADGLIPKAKQSQFERLILKRLGISGVRAAISEARLG